jgi:MEDS: MEthanogen/methylotroph, DcmR Sensory domain
VLGAQRHVCAFFHNPDEEYRILLPFITEGFTCGDRAFHVVDPKLREEHLRRLESAGIAVTATQHRRQLEVATVEETFLRGGRFNPDAMLALIQETLKTGATLGFPLTRFIAHVAERILEDGSNADEWIKCEARLNEVLPAYNDPVICTYDTNLINGTIAVDVLRTHPVAIVGGLLYENPFFVPPQELLRQVLQQSGAPPEP